MGHLQSVTDMEWMFKNAWAFNQDIGDWAVTSVTDMHGCSPASVFNQDIGGWASNSVTVMARMFWDNGAFNQDIGVVGRSGVKTMNEMFRGASAFNGDIGDWDLTASQR